MGGGLLHEGGVQQARGRGGTALIGLGDDGVLASGQGEQGARALPEGGILSQGVQELLVAGKHFFDQVRRKRFSHVIPAHHQRAGFFRYLMVEERLRTLCDTHH